MCFEFLIAHLIMPDKMLVYFCKIIINFSDTELVSNGLRF